MPTKAEQDELQGKCKWTWTSQNGVKGYKVVGPNGNSIFLPVAGCMVGESVHDVGVKGNYWSSSFGTYASHYAYLMGYNLSDKDFFYVHRCLGQSVRPICPKKEEHEYVDLGLSVKWATCNVGAEKPEDYGDYFAWGETKPKTQYDWSTYKYCKGTKKTLTKYCWIKKYGNKGFTDNKIVLDL